MSNLIKFYRKKRKLTQKQLAIRCGVKQSYISQLEHDVLIPSIPMLYQLSKVFKICPAELLNEFICSNCPYTSNCNHDCFKVPTKKSKVL